MLVLSSCGCCNSEGDGRFVSRDGLCCNWRYGVVLCWAVACRDSRDGTCYNPRAGAGGRVCAAEDLPQAVLLHQCSHPLQGGTRAQPGGAQEPRAAQALPPAVRAWRRPRPEQAQAHLSVPLAHMRHLNVTCTAVVSTPDQCGSGGFTCDLRNRTEGGTVVSRAAGPGLSEREFDGLLHRSALGRWQVAGSCTVDRSAAVLLLLLDWCLRSAPGWPG